MSFGRSFKVISGQVDQFSPKVIISAQKLSETLPLLGSFEVIYFFEMSLKFNFKGRALINFHQKGSFLETYLTDKLPSVTLPISI